jgi:hypothetical protein
MSEFSSVTVSDGCITGLHMAANAAQIYVQDWREETQVFAFDDVLGIAGFTFLDVDLSHTREATDEPFLLECCLRGNEQVGNFRSYAFYSVDADTPILKIVARVCSISPLNSRERA